MNQRPAALPPTLPERSAPQVTGERSGGRYRMTANPTSINNVANLPTGDPAGSTMMTSDALGSAPFGSGV